MTSRGGYELEALAREAYHGFDFQRSAELLEQAYNAHREAGNGIGAAKASRQLGFIYGISLGNGAAMQGWVARARSLLEGAEPSSEPGWVALTSAMFEGDRERKDMGFVEAIDVARRFGDRNLEFATSAYYGASLVHGDRIEEGMIRLDEACAAVVGGDVDDSFILEEIFCQLFSACEYARDITRAQAWATIGERVAADRGLPSVSAFCRTHYGGLLTAAGRWTEAEEALTEAVRIWGLGWGALRTGALVRLADLRVRQGRFEDAEHLLSGLELDAEAAHPVAALHLARGRHSLAADVLERALESTEPEAASSGPLWALLAEVRISAGDIDGARDAAEQTRCVAQRHPSHYLRATAALAQGRLCLAAGDGDARRCLREALTSFAKAQMPVDIALVRLELAHALESESPEVAVAEATAALDAFDRLHAARLADTAAAVVRRLGGPARTGPKDGHALTRRENEVLELLGLGLSNAEIAERLVISPKTAEHHVGNVLAKLGLKSRAQAAAYLAGKTRA